MSTSLFIPIHTNLPHSLERRGGLRVQLLRHTVVDEARKRNLLRLGQRAQRGEQVAARHLEARHLGQVGGAADGDGVGGEGGGEVGTRADLRGESSGEDGGRLGDIGEHAKDFIRKAFGSTAIKMCTRAITSTTVVELLLGLNLEPGVSSCGSNVSRSSLRGRWRESSC